MGMVFGLVEANPFGSWRFSLRAASCGLAFVSPDSQESANPPRTKGDNLPKSKCHAHSKRPLGTPPEHPVLFAAAILGSLKKS
jgi:hypothetical protein